MPCCGSLNRGHNQEAYRKWAKQVCRHDLKAILIASLIKVQFHVNNSGLVYEEKKAAQSSQLLVFVLCISVIYSKVTKSTTTTTTTIFLHLILLIHGEASTIKFKTRF